jgi:hypothetical protein
MIVQHARQKSFEGSQDPFKILTIAMYRSKAIQTSMMLLVSSTIIWRKENNEQATGPRNCEIDGQIIEFKPFDTQRVVYGTGTYPKERVLVDEFLHITTRCDNNKNQITYGE